MRVMPKTAKKKPQKKKKEEPVLESHVYTEDELARAALRKDREVQKWLVTYFTTLAELNCPADDEGQNERLGLVTRGQMHDFVRAGLLLSCPPLSFPISIAFSPIIADSPPSETRKCSRARHSSIRRTTRKRKWMRPFGLTSTARRPIPSARPPSVPRCSGLLT